MHTVVETAEFQKQAKAVWSDTEREAFIDWISANPDAGDVIPGADGCADARSAATIVSVCRGGLRVMDGGGFFASLDEFFKACANY